MTFLVRLTFADTTERRLLVRTARLVGIQHEAIEAVFSALGDTLVNYPGLLRRVEVEPVDNEIDVQEAGA